jgi:hypothetical protein
VLLTAAMGKAQRKNFEEDENDDNEYEKLCLIVNSVSKQADKLYY